MVARAPLSDEATAAESPWVARAARARARLQPHLPALRALAFAVALGIVVVMAVGALGEVETGELTWWPLPLALAAAAAWWLLLAHGWAVLASGRFTREDVATWCRTQALRYLPGGVWAPASRATVLHGRILDRISTVAAENVIALCAALAVGGVSFGLSGAPLWLPLVLAVAVPAIASRFISGHTRLAPSRTHRALLNYLVAYVCYAGAAVLVQGAVSGFSDPFQVAGAASIAWAVGLVVIFAPGGVGVRELAYVGLLSHAFPEGELAAAAVTLRGLTIVAELGALVAAGRPRDLGDGARRAAVAGAALVRRHAVFAGVLAGGIALRVLTSLAYDPAIVYYDSVDYLTRADNFEPGRLRPLGYSLFIRVLPGDSLAVVAGTQHLLGLVTGGLIYAVLVRLGVRRWLAALAAAPVLLDAYQVMLEEFVLTEALFAFLLVAGCAALLWDRRPGIVEAGLAGGLFAGVAVTRAVGAIVIVPALLTLLLLYWEGRHDVRRWVRSSALPAAALALAFAVPVVGYAAWFHHFHGSYSITSNGGVFLYGRVSTFADCKHFSVPPEEEILCPRQAIGHRPQLHGSTVNWYTWANYGNNKSPRFKLPEVPGRGALPGRFARRAILAQPWDYLQAVGHDFLRGFAPIRTRGADELPISRWQFTPHYPVFSRETERILRARGDHPPHARPALGRALRDYQRFGFTWGPVLIVSALAAALALLGVGRARRSGLRAATLLFASLPLGVFAATVAANTFTWRYQLVMAVVLPVAGALGLSALLEKRAGRYPAAGQPEPSEGIQ